MNIFRQKVLECLWSPNLNKTQKVFILVGLLSVAGKLKRWIPILYKWIKPGANLLRKYGKGSYVVITGSTDGIGKSLAFQFAKKGFNIVSISRTLSKLEATAEQIKAKYPKLDVINIQADFSKATEPGFWAPIATILNDLNVSILVNNVGIDSLELFEDMSEELVKKTLDINVYTCTFMTKILIKQLAKRKRSAVITLGSLAGKVPMSYFAIYNATKAYTEMMSLSLGKEHTNVDFLSIRPSEVSTGMTNNKPIDIFTISASQCSSAILSKFAAGHIESNGSWTHGLQEAIYLWLPSSIYDYVWNNMVVPDFCKIRKMPLVRRIK